MFIGFIDTRRPPWPHHVLALLAGGAMPFAFSPYDRAWLAPVALAILFALIRDRDAGIAARFGFLFGFGWFGFGAWWLAPTLHLYGHLPWLLAGFCVLLVGAVMALLPALWVWLAVRLTGRAPWLMAGFAVAAVGEEWLRGHLFTGLPWTALGNLLLDTPALGWVAWFGVYGAALLPALAAAATVQALHAGSRRHGLAGLAFCGLLFFVSPPLTLPDGEPKTAALIQGNIPQDRKWDATFLNETMQRYARLSAGVRADLIVWPEAAVPFFLSRSPSWNRWLLRQVQGWRTPLLFGGLKDLSDGTARNGLFSVLPGHDDMDFAGKQHLVPFGEYVPSWLPFLHTLVPEIASFRPAAGPGLLRVDGVGYGSLICYESLFPELARARVRAGAQVLVNVTNDAWYGHSPAAWQHFQAARMRAVETGRYVLRAANTGVTAVIAPDGRVAASLPWWTTSALQAPFRPAGYATRYVRWGDWPLLAGLLILLFPIIRRFGR